MTERGYKLVANGLVIERELTLQEWRVLGRYLVEVHNRTTWAIGDWLVYGSGRGDYGEYYDDAQALTGRSFDSLSQAARVSKAFPMDQRATVLPWSYYREVMPLDEAERQSALTLAAGNDWTRDGLAEYIRGRGANTITDGSVPSGRSEGARSAVAKRWNNWMKNKHHSFVQCPSCGHKFEPKRRHRLVALKKPSASAEPIDSQAGGAHP